MKKILFKILFCLALTSAFGQNKLTNSTWISSKDVTFQFKINNFQSSNFYYIHQFEIIGDTLHLIHDFSGTEVWEGEKKIHKKDFALPDSYFLILQSHPDSLSLKALNPSAIKIINDITKNYHFYLSDKEIIKWNKTNKKPKDISNKYDSIISFWNLNTILNERSISQLNLSSSNAGWSGMGYFDLKLTKTTYEARYILQDYDSKKIKKSSYYSGKMDSILFNKIQGLFQQTGIPDSGKIAYSGSWASHDENFFMEIYHNKGVSSIDGNGASLPDFTSPFFEILFTIPKEEDIIIEKTLVFPISKFEELK